MGIRLEVQSCIIFLQKTVFPSFFSNFICVILAKRLFLFHLIQLLTMRKTTLLIPFVALMASCAQQEDFNQGWRFALDADTTAAAPDFNDEAWRVIEIPHDWSVEYEKSNVSGVYRKHFKTPDKSDGQRVYLFFDGVCWQSDVYVNGKKAGSSSDGSNGFEYDITDLLRSSGDNVLAVAVNNSQQPDSLRNYASGICRDVRLQVLNPTHFKRSGISISTTDVSAEAAKIDVALSMDGTADCKVQLEVLMMPDDVVVKAEGGYKAGTVKIFKDVTIKNPKLWSPDFRHLYKVQLTATVNDKIVDTYSSMFGIHKLEYDDANGFTLNGKSFKINCVDINHEPGAISAAAYPRAFMRRLEILREMGCNAVRFTRSRPTEDFENLCETVGIIVLDSASAAVQARDIDEIMDRAGFKKDAFYLCKSQWTDGLVVHLMPHWNFSEGDTVEVIAYNNMKDVELVLNGDSLGMQEMDSSKTQLVWRVPFTPGELRAVGHSFDDIEISGVLSTAGKPARLASTADCYSMPADGRELSFVTVEVVDSKGVVVPDADNLITFSATGPVEIIGLDNGNSRCLDLSKGAKHKAFHGKCVCIVRSIAGKDGRVVVRATADGLADTEVEIYTRD